MGDVPAGIPDDGARRNTPHCGDADALGAWSLFGAEGILLRDRGLRTFSRSSSADLDSSTANPEETERALGPLKSDNYTLVTFGGGDAGSGYRHRIGSLRP